MSNGEIFVGNGISYNPEPIRISWDWIKCSERLPIDGTICNVSNGKDICWGCYLQGHWIDKDGQEKDVIYWLPLPSPPEEKDL